MALPNLQQHFKMERDVSGYVMGVVMMQGGRLVCYHFEVFHGEILKYPTYNKEIYDLMQSMKKWKHYLIGKETIIHNDHQ